MSPAPGLHCHLMPDRMLRCRLHTSTILAPHLGLILEINAT